MTQEGETITMFGDSGPEKLNFPTSCVPYEDKFLVADGGNMGNYCIRVFDQS